MCCTRLAGNTGRKNHRLRTIAQLCRAESLQLRHVSTIGKKLVKQQYLLHMSSQYGELRRTSGWDQFRSLRHPSKFQRVSCLGFVTAETSFTGGQPNFARCLAVSWAGTVYNTYIFGGSFPGWISPHAKFTLRPSLAFSYIGSITARHSRSGVSQTLRHGTRNGIPNIRRGRHLYSAGRPSRWASAHILVTNYSCSYNGLKSQVWKF